MRVNKYKHTQRKPTYGMDIEKEVVGSSEVKQCIRMKGVCAGVWVRGRYELVSRYVGVNVMQYPVR